MQAIWPQELSPRILEPGGKHKEKLNKKKYFLGILDILIRIPDFRPLDLVQGRKCHVESEFEANSLHPEANKYNYMKIKSAKHIFQFECVCGVGP